MLKQAVILWGMNMNNIIGQTTSAVNQANVTINQVKQAKSLPANNYTSCPEEISSKVSLAARAYATPQINFQGKWDKLLGELKSPKQSNKIKMSFEEASKFLERLGFSQRGGKGSHCNFVKDGWKPITIARPHDGHNTVKPYIIDELKNYITSNKVMSL